MVAQPRHVACTVPAVVASFNAGDDHHSNGHTAPAGVPSPVHLPPAVRIAAEEDDARRGVGPQAHKRSSVSHRARHSDIASALRDATHHKQKPVVKRESLPARSRPKADSKKSTLLYSPLILNSLGGFDGGLSHAGRHAVCLNLTNEQNDSQKHAEAVTSTAAGVSRWRCERAGGRCLMCLASRSSNGTTTVVT